MGGTPGPTNDVYSFDGTTWSLVVANADWTARYVFCSVVTDGKIFLYGGEPSNNEMWVSADGQSWEVVTTTGAGGSMPSMAFHQCIKFNNSIFILGGKPPGS